ncbi:HAMP domain-containing protein [Shewanella atlantica]|uniref:Sensor protein n=2 Tax=Shewanella atlantica TaxID=271099 RepID=A0A431WEF6_9GAMM|nr:HAMP domain-containing protein [Shewanella atlantica]
MINDEIGDMKIKQNLGESLYIDDPTSSSSLVATAGQFMAIIITLGLFSMISSILVTESLSGDAEQINRAGAMRMQAIRVSRANLIAQDASLPILSQEIRVFENKLSHLFFGGIASTIDNPEVIAQHQKIVSVWESIKQSPQTTSVEEFDRFTVKIDKLVSLLQMESEKKLSLLRLIQGITLFSILIVSAFVLFKLNRSLITPLKQLVRVAAEAGKGNFNIKVDHIADNELGLLSRTIGHMSKQLESTYQEFEDRVDKKTQELTQSNQSLEVLYRAASNLSNYEYHQIDQKIIQELVQVLGFGKVSIVLCEKSVNNLVFYKARTNTIDHQHMDVHQFVLEKRGRFFGDIVWQVPKHETPEEWQKQLLQAMADIVATAIELEQKKNSENRLLIAEERAVIARELHDSLAQSLSFLKVQMSLLTRKMQKGLPEEQVNETINDIKQGLNNAYLQLRELLTTFRLKLDDPSLENALQGTVAEFAEKCQHGIELKFEIPQNYLTANQEIHVLQIIRESLSNVHRHADASLAGVNLIKEDDKIKLEIWDDGKGLPTNLEQQGHFGLGIMKERAKSLNSVLNFKPNSPTGTKVLLEFIH